MKMPLKTSQQSIDQDVAPSLLPCSNKKKKGTPPIPNNRYCCLLLLLSIKPHQCHVRKRKPSSSQCSCANALEKQNKKPRPRDQCIPSQIKTREQSKPQNIPPSSSSSNKSKSPSAFLAGAGALPFGDASNLRGFLLLEPMRISFGFTRILLCTFP